MLQWVYRYAVRPGKAEEFRQWLVKNDQAMRDHAAEGWSYLGTWFAVRGFGDFDAESRWELTGYEALGAGFGDEEALRLAGELFGEFMDHHHRPQAVLLKAAGDVAIAEGA